MNVRPAPFELLGHVVAATLGDRPAWSDRIVRVHLHRTKLANEVKGLAPADVPAVLRPDCAGGAHGKQGAVIIDEYAFPRPTEAVGRTEPPRVALLEAAGSVPAGFPNPGRPDILAVRDCASIARPRPVKIALPPLKDPRSTIVVRECMPVPRLLSDVRREEMAGAVAFLKQRGILVTVADRAAPIREYRVTGQRDRHLHEGVIEIAVGLGFEVPA